MLEGTRTMQATDACTVHGTAKRERGGDSHTGRLFFATVREDPQIEVELLQPQLPGRIVVVGSAGCTALSLLAHSAQGLGACQVVAVDSNRSQNHLTEIK